MNNYWAFSLGEGRLYEKNDLGEFMDKFETGSVGKGANRKWSPHVGM